MKRIAMEPASVKRTLLALASICLTIFGIVFPYHAWFSLENRWRDNLGWQEDGGWVFVFLIILFTVAELSGFALARTASQAAVGKLALMLSRGVLVLTALYVAYELLVLLLFQIHA